MAPSATARARSDLDLARRCVSGDRAAQRDLFRRERGRVHAILWRIVGSNAEMEDLAQEAFVEIFRSMRGFRGEATLGTWIDRITVRVAFAHLARRRGETVRLSLVPEPASDDASAEERAMMREGARHLYAALDRVDAKQRIAFALYALDGRSMKDVAAAMDASVVATKVRVWRARRALEAVARKDPQLAELLGRERR